eukprot:Selendium_serpulae@DN8271_c0_g1_i1.p1
MRLDASKIRYMTNVEFRVLLALEMGMRNHELVPVPLVGTLANVRGGMGVARQTLQALSRLKLVQHDSKHYDGYRLTWQGYDILCLKTLRKRGLVESVGMR